MKLKDKTAVIDWNAYKDSLIKATTVDTFEPYESKRKRVDTLLGDFEAFSKYYFPNYCTSGFAPWQKRFAKKLIKNKKIYATRKVNRAGAKSVIAGLLVPMFLKFNNDLKNMILSSFTEDNACELLRPIQMNLEFNQRILHDFGMQKTFGNWESGKFITRDGCSFRAIGRGQNPRGTRNEEARPDYILCDDLDDDEACRSKERMEKAWEWLSGALYGCFDIAGNKRFVMVGNVIAKNSLLCLAAEQADDDEQVDILTKTTTINYDLIREYEAKLVGMENKNERKVYDLAISYLKQGYVVSWAERFSMLDVCYMLSKMGSRLAQREYFNNPLTEGKVFKKEWFQFKKLPTLNNYRFLQVYLDPGFKKTATSDTKSLVLVGLMNGEYHIIKAFVGQASIEEMIEWGYVMDAYIKARNGSYNFKMEEVFLQSLLYKDFAEAARKKKYPLPVSGDTRKKPDKDARIEATSGHFERGNVYFNEEEQESHHMKELIEQYLVFEPGRKTKKDGPDAVEGALFLLQQGLMLNADITVGKRATGKHKMQ